MTITRRHLQNPKGTSLVGDQKMLYFHLPTLTIIQSLLIYGQAAKQISPENCSGVRAMYLTKIYLLAVGQKMGLLLSKWSYMLLGYKLAAILRKIYDVEVKKIFKLRQ